MPIFVSSTPSASSDHVRWPVESLVEAKFDLFDSYYLTVSFEASEIIFITSQHMYGSLSRPVGAVRPYFI